jgi:uracil-DNA glycosylase
MPGESLCCPPGSAIPALTRKAAHPRLRPLMPAITLTVLVGQYAHAIYLPRRPRASVTETVAAWRGYLPEFMVTPHPSWRVNGWLTRNPWFTAELVPELQRRVRALV